MQGLAILFLFNFLGVALNVYGHVPLPGNVIGLLLLLLALVTKVVRVSWVEDAAHFLLRHMLLFFAPVIVGTLALVEILRSNWVPLASIIVVSTLVTALATAVTANVLMPRDER